MQTASAANSLARLNVGINIDISRAMMDITTNNSINVNPLDLLTLLPLNPNSLFYPAGTGN
jgi:hypothetical protein